MATIFAKDIDDKLHAAFLAWCKTKGKTMREYVIDMIRDEIPVDFMAQFDRHYGSAPVDKRGTGEIPS